MSSASPLFVLIATVVIIATSAFFVAVEFASMAAKRHRLEDRALESRRARAALRSSSELTLLLAGSQLGITVCTLALGALTEPAVHHWLTPWLESVGLPGSVAGVAGFVIALTLVTFLHLVVGEMAPKSWAIAHPEKSAMLLALPMRGFMWVFRPALRVLNAAANWLLRKAGVEPADQLATRQSASDLRALVAHSVNVGALDARYATQISEALEMQTMTIGDIVGRDRPTTQVSADATVDDVREASRTSGHLRILVGSHAQAITGMIHVRDTLTAAGDAGVQLFIRPVHFLDETTTLHAALAEMRRTRNHLAVVTHDDVPCGVITLTDILLRLFPTEGHARSMG